MRRDAILLPLLLSLSVAALSCDEDLSGPAPGEEFTLRQDESVYLEAVDAFVLFLGVAEDSRCPARAECVWAGDAAVVLERSSPSRSAALDTLHTNLEAGRTAVILGSWELALVRLDPYPEVPGRIPPEEYRATLALYGRLD